MRRICLGREVRALLEIFRGGWQRCGFPHRVRLSAHGSGAPSAAARAPEYGRATWLVLFALVAVFANLGFPFEFPNAAEALRLALTVAIAIYAALSVSILRARSLTSVGLIWFGMALTIYIFGAASLANAAFDRSRPVPKQVAIAGKAAESDNGEFGTQYRCYLHLAPWSEQSDGGSVDANAALYNSVAVGDSVCFDVRQGRLGISWYQGLAKCAGGHAASTVRSR
jgi:hypothetical protein